MLGAIGYNLRHLLDFSGRDARQTFWYYVLFVFIINMVASFAIAIPYIGRGMAAAISAASSGDPAAINAAMSETMGGMIEFSAWAGVALAALNILLLAAALVRRLHDSDHSGGWAIPVAAIYAAGQGFAILNIDKSKAMLEAVLASGTAPQAMMGSNPAMGVQTLLSWLPLLVFAGFGVLKSTDGPNRFADEPIRF